MKYLLLTTAACMAVTPAALAGDFTDSWGGEAALSGSTTSGNTETTDIGLALHLNKTHGVWKHNFDTTYDLGKAGGVDNKNRWYIGYKLDRKIIDRLYAYANTNYFTDDFSAYKQGSFVGAGLGYTLFEPDPMAWSVEAGAGYRSQKLREIDNMPSVKETDFALRGASKFDYKFNDAVGFYNNSEVIWSDSDTYLWTETGVTATLAGNLAARFSFRVDHHTDVPAGVEKTDTITRGSLVYTLK